LKLIFEDEGETFVNSLPESDSPHAETTKMKTIRNLYFTI